MERNGNPDVVVAFAFGKFEKLSNSPNFFLAERAVNLAKKWNVPIFTQIDVSVLMSDTKKVEIRFAEERKRKGHLSSLGIALQLTETSLIQNGRLNVLVVAAPPHIGRCVRDIRKLGFKVEEDLCLKSLPFHFWFRNDSLQWWTRSWWQWWLLYEIPLRLMPWWFYKRIAG